MKPLNVLLITVDCLRADALARLKAIKQGRSNIERLASEGCNFTNAITASNTTAPSLVSMLTSVYPQDHNVLVNGMRLDKNSGATLPEVLRQKGYATLGVVSAEQLSSPFGLNRGFTHYVNNSGFDHISYLLTKVKVAGKKLSYALNVIRERFNVFSTAWTSADKTTERAKRLLSKSGTGPFFLWIHYFDAHQYSTEEGYNAKIQYIDDYVGYLLNHLKKLNKMDDTLIVLTGDHGEAFGEHGYSQHGWSLYDEVVKVPLIFYCKKEVPLVRIESQVRTIDIAPTILEMLKINSPSNWQGRSLLDYITGKRGEDLLAKTLGTADFDNIESVRSGVWKLIHSPKRGTELYNLRQDTQEQKNVVGEYSEVEKELRGHLSGALANAQPQEEVDEAVKSRLRSLGYFDESV